MSSSAVADLVNEARTRFAGLIDYEADHLLRLDQLLVDATRFVDVGANRGLYSFIANNVMRDAEIILIEANPALSKSLENDIKGWRESTRNKIRVLPFAAGDVEAVLPFKVESDHTLGSLVRSDFVSSNADTIDVPVEPLDSLLPVKAGTVFKIDVEGYEYRVLKGAKAHLSAPDCKAVVELHGWGDKSAHKYPLHVFVLMRNAGFKVEQLAGAHFVFSKGSLRERWLSFLRFMPLYLSKFALRRSGLHPTYHKMRRTLKRSVS